MKLLLLPPDTRPPTLSFPQRLAQCLGLDLSVAPKEALNQLNQPGDFEALKTWLKHSVTGADCLILSLEQLCLGGMIPARRVNDRLETALSKLELLKELKTLNPNIRILAFGVIVRVAHGNDPLEEKPYYAEYGDALRAYSEAFDRAAREPSREHESALKQRIKAVPETILNDWLATRQRNHQVHHQALELCQAGILEHLCLCLDDTSNYGLAAADRRALEHKTDALGLWSQVDIYPGADEVPCSLLVRALNNKAQKVYLRYSGSLGAQSELIFEDRPAGELIKAQLRAARCQQVTSLAEADFVLAVNSPGSKQAHVQPDFATVDTTHRHLPEFIDFIRDCLASDTPLSIADIAYPNGAEIRFMKLLESCNLASLAGFSGWNTAGNSLGTAIAMGAVAKRVKDQQLFSQLLFDRLVDDYLYQSIVRNEVEKELQATDPFDLGDRSSEAEKLINARLEPLALQLWQAHFQHLPYQLNWQKPRLAWPRLFTLELSFSLSPKNLG